MSKTRLTRWTFSTNRVRGEFASDGVSLRSSFHDARTGAGLNEVRPDWNWGPLLPYRVLSRDGWHGELRDMPHRFTALEDGFEAAWEPSLAHPVAVVIRTRLTAPDTFDTTIELRAAATLTDYEITYSHYLDNAFDGGAWVIATDLRAPGTDPSRPDPAQCIDACPSLVPWAGKFIAFPRDERAAHMLTDGRWQRGRYCTRFIPGRYYAMPLVFQAHRTSPLAVLWMAAPDDAYAVSMITVVPPEVRTAHNSLYLPLFGRTIHAGETATTRHRMVWADCGRDAVAHVAHYRRFLGTGR